LDHRFEISADLRDGHGARITPIAQVENEPRVADGFPAESGWSYVTPAKKSFHFSKQMHAVILILGLRLGWALLSNAFPTCLGSYLLLKGH
jgi:hypothetical protein